MQKDCRILMVGPDPDGHGGISRVVKNWREAGFFKDHRITYFSTVTDRPVNRVIHLAKALFSFLGRMLKKDSIVYIHVSSNHSFFRKSAFIIIAIAFRRVIILHVHPTHFVDFVEGLQGLFKWYVNFLLRRIDFAVVLTHDMLCRISSHVPNAKLHKLNNPVDVKELQRSTGERRSQNQILYLGWYLRPKGVYDLIEAVDILLKQGEKLRLNLYGTKGVEALRSHVAQKGLAKSILVNDWIADTQKIKVLRESTMLVLPSYSEGVPNVILEAMASKTPIVATSVGGLKEILVDGQNALIAEVGNPNDLSIKIKSLLNDPEMRYRIAENAYSDACNKFDIKIIKREFENLIRSVTGES